MDRWHDVAQLYEAHAPEILRLAVLLCGSRAVAEEITQDTFVRYFGSSTSIRSGREIAYLRRIAVNLAYGRHRHETVRRKHLLRSVPIDVAALRTLSYRQQVCVVLHYWGGLSDAEIGDALDISTGSVKVHLHRARGRLAELLEDAR